MANASHIQDSLLGTLLWTFGTCLGLQCFTTSCGQEPIQQVRMIVEFKEPGRTDEEPPVCLGGVWMRAFVHDVRNDEPVGEYMVGKVSLSNDDQKACVLDSPYLVLKGVELNRKFQLTIQILDASMTLLASGDSVPFMLTKNTDMDEDKLEIELTRSAEPGSVRLELLGSEDYGVFNNGFKVLLVDENDTIRISRLVPAKLSADLKLDPDFLIVSGLANGIRLSIDVVGLDDSGKEYKWQTTDYVEVRTQAPDWAVTDVTLDQVQD